MRRSRVLGFVLAAPWLVGVARAHEVTGSRFDAPLPLGLLFGGAGVTVAATAWWLAAADRDHADRASVSVSLPSPRAGRALLRLAGLLAFAGVLGFGLFGTDAAADNPATLFAWAVALKGVALVAVVAGSPWRYLSPWRTVYEAFAALEGRDLAAAAYPARLGAWPAVLGFVAIVGVAENLTEIPQSPRLTAGLLAAYALVMLAGGFAFGRDFFANADALEVLYRLLGRVSPLGWRERSVRVRTPWESCARPAARRGVAAFVVAAVYTVSFDGFANTPEYQSVYYVVREAAGVYTPLVVYGAGLAAFLAAYGAVAAATERAGGRAARSGTDAAAAAAAFAPTVLPIAAAYEVAHNYPFVARNLASLLSLAADRAVSLLGWLSVPAFWWSQVALVVAGHVLAVAAAHRVAVRRYGDRAVAAHRPLVALMVGYTVLSLWIVSRPVVA